MKKNTREKGGRQEVRVRFSDDLIWGVHAVLEALRTDPARITELILLKDKRGSSWQEIIDAARAAGIKISFAERLKVTDNPDGTITHQGVIAKAAPVTLMPFEELLDRVQKQIQNGQHPKVLACDSLQDPHNLGAIIRSAHASGFDHVLVTRERSAPLGGSAAKAAAGSLARVHISQAPNLSDGLAKLKDVGFWVFGAVKDPEGQSLYGTTFDVPVCLVIGNEAQGIRPLVRRHCDILISIPMCRDIESLNSSVAGAVIMFEVYRQQLAAAAQVDDT